MIANEVLKQHSAGMFAWAVVVSTAAHFALLAYAPSFEVGSLGVGSSELTAIELAQPDVEIPPPPQALARPAIPVVSAAQIDERITIAPTTFEANPIVSLPAPPSASREETGQVRDAPVFTPMTVHPVLLNEPEVRMLLERYYPPLLRDAGISGLVVVWFFIDTTGKVINTQIHGSSGYSAMDEAALRVADVMRFRPAKNRDKIVEVWVQIPIEFSVRVAR